MVKFFQKGSYSNSTVKNMFLKRVGGINNYFSHINLLCEINLHQNLYGCLHYLEQALIHHPHKLIALASKEA